MLRYFVNHLDMLLQLISTILYIYVQYYPKYIAFKLAFFISTLHIKDTTPITVKTVWILNSSSKEEYKYFLKEFSEGADLLI